MQAEFGINLVPPVDDDAQRVGKLVILMEFVSFFLSMLVLEDGIQEIESMLKVRSDVLPAEIVKMIERHRKALPLLYVRMKRAWTLLLQRRWCKSSRR